MYREKIWVCILFCFVLCLLCRKRESFWMRKQVVGLWLVDTGKPTSLQPYQAVGWAGEGHTTPIQGVGCGGLWKAAFIAFISNNVSRSIENHQQFWKFQESIIVLSQTSWMQDFYSTLLAFMKNLYPFTYAHKLICLKLGILYMVCIPYYYFFVYFH